MIYNATVKRWIPFRLWDAQAETLGVFTRERNIIILKARQLGLSWLALCYLLWQMIFHPAVTVLIFSKRDDEAVALLTERLKEIHAHLPQWMQQRLKTSNDHTWIMHNGSGAKAFPTTGGRSYTASIVLMDEADFMIDFGKVMNAVQPTIDAGGQMIVISTVDKEKPESAFKRMYNAAREGKTEYYPIFLPWHARPSRTAEWYEARVQDSLAQNGTLDSVHQEYPATEEEALAPNTVDKRFVASWLLAVYQPLPVVQTGPAIPGLLVYKPVQAGQRYVIGADPAEGNPNSDDSAATVLEVDTGDEVARLSGKFEPGVFAAYLDSIGKWYNNASVMVERNNHGHAVLLALFKSAVLRRLLGKDGKAGWLNNAPGKVAMYDALAETIRNNALVQNKTIHSKDTFLQLASIEGATLKAPEGQMDDLADSYALAEVGRAAAMMKAKEMQPSVSQVSL
jgi:hypothetical protein